MAPRPSFLQSVVATLCGSAIALSPLSVAAQGAAKPAPDGKELVAVLDLEAVNTDKFQASALTDRFREELLKSGRFTVVDRAQMNKVLEEQALQQTGCTSSECAVQVGKILGVRKIISGRVTRIQDDLWLISASMVDVETAETLRAESQQHEGNFRTLLSAGIGALAAKVAQGAGGPARKPDAAALAAQLPPPPAPAAKPEEVKEEGGGVKWYWWALGGVAIAGAAAASGSSKSPSKKTSPTCANCGSVSVSW